MINTATGVAGAPAAFLTGKPTVPSGGGSELDHVVAAKHAYLRAIEDAVLLVKVLPPSMASSWSIAAISKTVSHDHHKLLVSNAVMCSNM